MALMRVVFPAPGGPTSRIIFSVSFLRSSPIVCLQTALSSSWTSSLIGRAKMDGDPQVISIELWSIISARRPWVWSGSLDIFSPSTWFSELTAMLQRGKKKNEIIRVQNNIFSDTGSITILSTYSTLDWSTSSCKRGYLLPFFTYVKVINLCLSRQTVLRICFKLLHSSNEVKFNVNTYAKTISVAITMTTTVTLLLTLPPSL